MPAFAQNQTSLQGRVISDTGEKVEFYTLILQLLSDSSVVSVDMFSDSVFRFVGIKPQTYILRLQDIQYQPYDTLITIVEGTNVLKTPLVLKPKTLGEVVVRGSRPVLKYNHGNITVDVANSYLKDDVSVENILGKLPGVIVSNDGIISMFGKGTPRIYINNAPRSADDLRALQPADIDKIEIIRNVGVEYESNVNAVIKIRTKKRREEKYHVLIGNSLMLGSTYLSNRPRLRLYLGNNEKLTQYISSDYQYVTIDQHNKSSAYTYFDDYTNSQLRDNYSSYKFNGPQLFYTLNYSINDDAELGVQYIGGLYNDRDRGNGTQDYDDETTHRTVDVNSENKEDTNLSNINVNYTQKIHKTGELSILADYAIRNTYDITDVKESTANWNANNITDADNNGKVFSVTPEYKVKGKKITYSAGLKYISLHSKSATEFRPSMDMVHTQLSEYSTGAYMVFDADLSFVDIKSGIRMEYTNSEIQSDDELNNLSRDYSNWIPYVSLSSELNEHLNLTAYYRQRLDRPSLYRLNSTMIYIDSLSYMRGNPGLKPVTTDVFGFNAGVYKFDFLLEYSINRNEIIDALIPDSKNPNILISTPINKQETSGDLTVEVSYSFNHPAFSNMTNLNYGKQFNVNMPFRNEIIRFDRPRYYFQTSGDVKIFKNTSLNYSYRYTSGGDNGYTRTYTPKNRFAFDLVQYFMSRKLMISIGTYFSNQDKYSSSTTYYNGNIVQTQEQYSGFGTLTFNVRYNWGANKSIQQKSSNSDINRL
jgi:hypothetical protein